MTSAGDLHHVAGEIVELRRTRRRRRNVAARRESGRVIIEMPETVPRGQEQRWLTEMVALLQKREQRRRRPAGDDALMERARALHAAYLLPVAPRAPLPAAVSWVENQQRRWGSCTVPTRTIRLSTRLREMPVWVVDYVLLHELAHLVEPGHGPEFHALLAGYPRTAEASGYLSGWSDAMAARLVAGAAGESAQESPGEVDQDGD